MVRLDPINEAYRLLRRLGEHYIGALNRRDRVEFGTERYERLCGIINTYEESLASREKDLAHLLGVPCRYLWHPMIPKKEKITNQLILDREGEW
jgi:hypothetical protein